MNKEDFLEDSDSSDEDYVPDGKQEENVSEVESDGDPEEQLSDSEQSSSKLKRGKTNGTATKKRKREPEALEEKNEKVEEKKTNVDDLWADFIKDTGFKGKNSKNDTSAAKASSAGSTSKSIEQDSVENKSNESKPLEKVKITQIFEFAGEEVKVEKEVDASSAEARLAANKPTELKPSKLRKSGGLSGVLSQIGKKQKINTLEKSKLDWDKFKKEENIEEELQTYNKGKDGFLDRQDFLQRADLRRFEIEKEVRAIERSKRLNSTL